MTIPAVLERLAYRYPSVLVDRVTDHVPGRSIVAVKNVTISEEFFQGHFPGAPLMPGVLMIESLTQVATLLLLPASQPAGRAWLRAVEHAKFRRQVVPGDRLELQVTLGRRRGRIARASAVATVAGEVVAEADLVLAVDSPAASARRRAYRAFDGDRRPGRAAGRRHGRRPVRHDRAERHNRPALQSRRVERRRRHDGYRRRHGDLSRSRRLAWRRRTSSSRASRRGWSSAGRTCFASS